VIRRAAAPVLVVALGLCLYLPGLGVELLRHPLEAKYALAAREMLRGGPLLVAHLFGEVYPDKPPLLFWATAALGRAAGGIDEVVARLPAVAGALVAALATWRLGTDLFGSPGGLVAGLALATANLFFWYARQGHPDQLLTAFVALAMLAWWRGAGRDPAAPRAGPVAAAYAAMALGVMSKGLLGLLLPLAGAAGFLALTGPPRAALAGLRLGVGLPVFLGVLLAWYAPAVLQQGPGYLRETIVHQHVERYARTWVHAGPWYYYLGEFASGFFPWVLFLPGAVALGWRLGGRAFRLPLAWFAAGFVFLSLSTSKRGAYLLPLYPAAALMVGWLWARALGETARPSRWVTAPLAVLGAVALALAAALPVVPRRLWPGNMVDTLVPAGPLALAGTAGLLAAGVAAVWLAWRQGRRAGALGALVACQGLALLAVAAVRAPQYEARFPAREFAARLRAADPGDGPLPSLLGDYDFIVAFYADRPLRPLAGPSELLAARRPGAPTHALVDRRDLPALGAARPAVLAEARLGPKPVVLVRLDPPGA
jgi:4-amino-4-deoxy-L-arabinose transferase-like glycosyltransferase